MRTLNRNKQKMYYALLVGTKPEYELDEDGNPIVEYVDDDGTEYYRETGRTVNQYSEPVDFFGNIAMSGGDSVAVEYGVNLADYEAILITPSNTLPLTETSLIWANTSPTTDIDGGADGKTADYSVIKVSPSLNIDKYILKKVVK